MMKIIPWAIAIVLAIFFIVMAVKLDNKNDIAPAVDSLEMSTVPDSIPAFIGPPPPPSPVDSCLDTITVVMDSSAKFDLP